MAPSASVVESLPTALQRLPCRQGKAMSDFPALGLVFTHLNSVSLAAAWDRKVIEDVCEILVAEARSKEVDVLLGPTGNLPLSNPPKSCHKAK